MEVSTDFKVKVRQAMLTSRENYGGSDKAYSKTLEINNAVFSRVKAGEIDKVLDNGEWIRIARKLNVSFKTEDWKIARTEVYNMLEDNFNFCQKNSVSMVFVDECEIGKTVCAQVIISKMKNAFYIDCSQVKTKREFIKAIAIQVGSGTNCKYIEMLENLKYYLNILDSPFICLDEAGDLDFNAFLEIKALMNATVDKCSWYMIGADGLRSKINKGINNHKVGYAEIFSRFSGNFTTIVPKGKDDKINFYKKLIGDVAFVNIPDKSKVNYYINLCLPKFNAIPNKRKKVEELENNIRGLRYLKTSILVNREHEVTKHETSV